MINNYNLNEEAVKRVMEINEKIAEENEKEVVDDSKLTKLMFEQLLRGIYLGQ